VTPDQQDARAESTTATDAVPGEEVLASNQNNDQQNPPSEQDAQEPAEKLAPSRRRDAQPGHRPADRAELAVADDVDGPLKDQALANAVANRPSTELAAEAIDVLDGDGDAAADTESTDAKPASSALLDGDRSAGLTGAINRLQRTPGRVAADNSAGTSPPTVRVDSARFVGRVAHAFRIAQERGGTLQLRLSPPELGSLKLEVSIHQGVLSAKIDAETTAARNALLDNLPALRDRLAEQNIRIEQFDVDVRQEGGDSRQFQPNQRRDDGHQSFRNAANIHGSDSTEEDTEPSAVPRTVDTNAAIDLII
jgi:flagellar hook-length control protein FliK